MKARNRGTIYVPRKEARENLERATRRQADKTLLLPPYVSVAELRIIFRVDYAGVCRLLGVRREQGKYYWRDREGRQFETTSKRKVMVPFDIAAVPATELGLIPKMLDVEPDWDVTILSAAVPVPVVAVLGHINHGKTTLLDALCGTDVAASEPGGITQEVRAITGELATHTGARPLVAVGLPPSEAGREERRDALTGGGRFDAARMTFLDTPGHEAFELTRGRTMAAADVAIVVVSVERGAEVQTEEVLLHAARWKVPVVFALNKIDLPSAHIELTRAELRRQCQRLNEQGLVDIDWTAEAEAAVPISALYGMHLEDLIGRVQDTVRGMKRLPAKPVEPPTRTPGEGRRCKGVQRRTDLLVGIEPPPASIALVVEYERGAVTGEHVLTLIVRSGKLCIGQFFVVGTAFGRITYMAVATGGDDRGWRSTESAGAGVAVKVMGLKLRTFGGDCAPDDHLFVLPRERAYRLSEHRRRVEAMIGLQTAGPEVEVPWEHDPHGMGARTQSAFERSRHDHPESHSSSAYEQRMSQPAVEEITATKGTKPIFAGGSRRDFGAPLVGGVDRFESDDDVDADSREVDADAAPRGRRSRRAKEAAAAEQTSSTKSQSRFAVVQPAREADEAPSGGRKSEGGGRKSKSSRAPTGAWTARADGPGVPGDDFVYYTSRKTWTEEAEIDSSRLRARWQGRDIARWEEADRQKQMEDKEKMLAERTRRQVFGEPDPEEEEEDDYDEAVQEEEEEEPIKPLPARGIPVVPMILKTKNVGQFDVLMDEVERVQNEFGVRVVIVHGGLGPVIPKDVIHAEVEKKYGFCPIYAFQVGTHPVAAGHAEKESIDIRRFDVFTDLVADVTARCERIRRKDDVSGYGETLKTRPTSSGF